VFEPVRKYRWQHTVTDNPKSPDRFANPYIAAIIVPSQTRAKLITSFRSLETKRDTNPKKKHGNIPL
jgi:acetyl-CoA carboxylase carboxyltransferase component